MSSWTAAQSTAIMLQLTNQYSTSSIRIWSLKTGEAVHVLYGHDSFIYSLSPIPDSEGGGLISGGEDRTMRVWRGELAA